MKYVGFLFLIIILFSCASPVQEPDLKWQLPAMDFDRQDCPVSIILPEDIEPESNSPVLSEVVNGQSKGIPCQMYINDDNLYVLNWIVPGLTKAGEVRVFELRFEQADIPAGSIDVQKNDTTIFFSKGDQPILHYRYSLMQAPRGQTALFDRSGFIHPLYSPSGAELTWAQPPDHFHHVGIWNPWTRVTWKGINTDFWNLGSGQGTVRFVDVISSASGPVFAESRVLQDHIAFMPPKSGDEDNEYDGEEVVVLEEEWIIRVWNIEDGYLIDFISLIRNILDEPISLDAYRYGGGIGYRATEKWNRDNSSVLTSEGKVRSDGDASRAKWCWISGDLEGAYTGLLFMSDTTNYDFPQPMRIWPENSNGVGHQYFEFTPIREKAWILQPEKTYSQNYRIWVKEGQLGAEEAEQQWLQYVKSMDQKISYLSK